MHYFCGTGYCDEKDCDRNGSTQDTQMSPKITCFYLGGNLKFGRPLFIHFYFIFVRNMALTCLQFFPVLIQVSFALQISSSFKCFSKFPVRQELDSLSCSVPLRIEIKCIVLLVIAFKSCGCN